MRVTAKPYVFLFYNRENLLSHLDALSNSVRKNESTIVQKYNFCDRTISWGFISCEIPVRPPVFCEFQSLLWPYCWVSALVQNPALGGCWEGASFDSDCVSPALPSLGDFQWWFPREMVLSKCENSLCLIVFFRLIYSEVSSLEKKKPPFELLACSSIGQVVLASVGETKRRNNSRGSRQGRRHVKPSWGSLPRRHCGRLELPKGGLPPLPPNPCLPSYSLPHYRISFALQTLVFPPLWLWMLHSTVIGDPNVHSRDWFYCCCKRTGG